MRTVRLIILSLIAPAASAQYMGMFVPPNTTARVAGFGGAGVAVVSDVTAIATNPAGLAQLNRRSEAVTYDDYRATNHETSIWQSNTIPPESADWRASNPQVTFAGIAAPFRWRGHMFAAGAAYNSSAMLLHEPDALTFYTFPFSLDGRVDEFRVALASKLTDHLNVGASLNHFNYNAAEAYSYEYDPKTRFAGSFALHFQQTYFGLGLQYEFSPQIVAGLSYQSRFSASANYMATTESSSPQGGSSGEATTRGVVRASWPHKYAAGIAWRSRPDFLITSEYRIERWQAVPYLRYAQPYWYPNEKGEWLLQINDGYVRPLNATGTDGSEVRFGMEKSWQVPFATLAARLGASSGDLLSSRVPDAKFHALHLGTGIRFHDVAIDLAYVRIRSDDAKLLVNYTPTVLERVRVSSRHVVLTTSLQF